MHLDRQETFFGCYTRSPSSHAFISACSPSSPNRSITCDSLVVGAIETAFIDMVPKFSASLYFFFIALLEMDTQNLFFF